MTELANQLIKRVGSPCASWWLCQPGGDRVFVCLCVCWRGCAWAGHWWPNRCFISCCGILQALPCKLRCAFSTLSWITHAQVQVPHCFAFRTPRHDRNSKSDSLLCRRRLWSTWKLTMTRYENWGAGAPRDTEALSRPFCRRLPPIRKTWRPGGPVPNSLNKEKSWAAIHCSTYFCSTDSTPARTWSGTGLP